MSPGQKVTTRHSVTTRWQRRCILAMSSSASLGPVPSQGCQETRAPCGPAGCLVQAPWGADSVAARVPGAVPGHQGPHRERRNP